MAMSNADRARVGTRNSTKSANSISNRDAQILKEARIARAGTRNSTKSANSISNRDAQILEEARIARAIRKARKDFLSREMGSVNSISNRDVKMLEDEYMKRNDGGMAMSGRGKPVRTF